MIRFDVRINKDFSYFRSEKRIKKELSKYYNKRELKNVHQKYENQFRTCTVEFDEIGNAVLVVHYAWRGKALKEFKEFLNENVIKKLIMDIENNGWSVNFDAKEIPNIIEKKLSLFK